MTMDRSPLLFVPGENATLQISAKPKDKWTYMVDLIIPVANKSGIPTIHGETQYEHLAFIKNRSDDTRHDKCTGVITHEVQLH